MQIPKSDSTMLAWERGALIVAAILLFACAAWATTSPEALESKEADGSGKIIKTTVTQKSRTELALLLSAAGILVLFLGVNGFKLAKLTVGGVSAETRSQEVKAAEKYAKTEQAPKEVDLPATETEDDNEPKESAEGKVLLDNFSVSVYKLEAVPDKVIEDAFSNWPRELPKPSDLSAFEFATRRSGKGSFPWLLKFRDLPAIRVTYGGYGKKGATVRASDG